MIKLSLTKRGILLSLFPLACQLVFVAFLSQSLFSVQKEIDKESQSKELIARAQTLVQNTVGSLIALAYDFDQGKHKMDSKRVFKELELNYRSVIELASAEPEQAPQVERLKEVLDVYAYASGMTGTTIYAPQGQILRHGQPYTFDHIVVLKELISVVKTIIITEEQRRAGTEKRLKDRINAIGTIIFVAIPASLLISLMLGYLYATGIRQPLLRIGENSLRLSRFELLLPELKGDDELSRLDQLLHTAANSINQAVQSERALIDNAADLICSIDERDVFKQTNPFCRRMLGWSQQELIGQSVFDIVSGDDAGKADESLQAMRKSKDTHCVELRLKRKDGAVIDTQWSSFFSKLEKSLFCVVQDVTERKNIERLKEDFVQMISHDLRSPLASMSAALEFVAEGAGGELSQGVATEVGHAQRNIERLMSFVNDLLDFQKLKAGKMQLAITQCEWKGILDEAADLVRSVAESKQIEIVIPDTKMNAFCDRSKIIQVVTNLLSNAIKFAPAQSTVAIEVENFSDTFELRVIDSGPGIPSAYAETIFEAFEQVPGASAGQGTGLGLAVCKLIVESHGGTIGVRNRTESGDAENPRGSIFWFRLPKSA